MSLADYLSRAKPEVGHAIELETTGHVVNATHNKIEQIKIGTKTDPDLGPLLERINSAWMARWFHITTERDQEILICARPPIY